MDVRISARESKPVVRDAGCRRAAPTGGFTRAALLSVLAGGLLVACGGGPRLDTRTYELEHLDPAEAMSMVAPYVYLEREGAPGAVTSFPDGITVRETADNLDRIARVIAEYDRPKPGVRLHFQVIEADGFSDPDPRIAEVRDALDQLFRFEGYRLVTETQVAGMEGTGSTQQFYEGDLAWQLRAGIDEVRGRGATASVRVSVALQGESVASGYIETSLAVPVGQTVVLGSSKPRDAPTLILTVRPELVALPDSTG